MKKKYGKGFPRYTLGGVIKAVEEAAKHGRIFSREAFAAFGVRGGTSPNSGAFLMRMAALTDFGLITQSKGEVSLTDLAWNIVHPESDKERHKSIQDAFLNSEVFSAIYNSSQKNIPLNIDAVGNMAVRQYNITSKYKQDFLRNFISSGEDAGLISKIDKQTMQFNPLGTEAEASKKDTEIFEEEKKLPEGLSEMRKTEGSPIVNETRGNENFKVQLTIYSNRPLKPEVFTGIGEIVSKIDELITKMEQ